MRSRLLKAYLLWLFPIFPFALFFLFFSLCKNGANSHEIRALTLSPGRYVYVLPLEPFGRVGKVYLRRDVVPFEYVKLKSFTALYSGSSGRGSSKVFAFKKLNFPSSSRFAWLFALFRSLRKFRKRCRTRLGDFPLFERELYRAVIFGERSSLRLDFLRAGLAHVLVVSGLHLVVIFYILELLLNGLCFLVGLKLSYFWRGFLRIVLSLASFALFVSLSGLTPSIFRAFVMTMISSVAFSLGRRVSLFRVMMYSLFFSLFIFKPDVSMMYTFAAVSSFIPLEIASEGLGRSYVSSGRVSFSKGFFGELGLWFGGSVFPVIFTAPLSLHFFGKAYLLGIFMNPVVAMVFPLVLFSGFVYVLSGALPGFPVLTASFINSFVLRFSGNFLSLHGRFGTIPLVIFFALEITIFLVAEGIKLRVPFFAGFMRKVVSPWRLVLMSVSIPVLLLGFELFKKENVKPMEVIFLGPSSYPVIFIKDDKAVVVNPGSERNSGHLSRVLKENSVKEVEAVFITNPRRAGGLMDTVGDYSIKHFFDVGLYARGTRAYDELLSFVTRMKIPYKIIRKGFSWEFAGAEFRCIYPPEKPAFGIPNMDEAVLKVTYGGKSMILMGGLSRQAQPLLVEMARKELKATVLESTYPPRSEVLSKVSPRVVIVSSYMSEKLPSKFYKVEKLLKMEFPELKIEEVRNIGDGG